VFHSPIRLKTPPKLLSSFKTSLGEGLGNRKLRDTFIRQVVFNKASTRYAASCLLTGSGFFREILTSHFILFGYRSDTDVNATTWSTVRQKLEVELKSNIK